MSLQQLDEMLAERRPDSLSPRQAAGVAVLDQAGISVTTGAEQPDLATLAGIYLEQTNRLRASAQGRVAALRRLTRLRRTNEELQNCFYALERRFPPGARDLAEVFADEPLASKAGLNLGWSSHGLAQALPVSSSGVSAIELHLRDIRGGAGAMLHVHLASLEDHRVIDRWTIPLDRVVDGWIMCCLTRALVGPTRTLELRLDLECDADVNVGLSLGRSQTFKVFQARNPVSNLPAADTGLAMRVWCGDAHSAYGGRANAFIADRPVPAQRGIRSEPLSPTLLAQVSHVTAHEVNFDFDPVTWIPYRVAIACHPPAYGMTMGVLPLPTDNRVTSVSADVEVGNEKSKPVEFAIVLAEDGESARALLLKTAEPTPQQGFSGWLEVAATGTGQLSAAVAKVGAKPAKLFVATRMRIPGNQNFAWARFRKLTIGTAW
ncbi:DUF6212 domain-containing protein [uncultured Devosia sp.]|uniref:DUF6212 domain-containing protein n=1 Tax=uncultured Devosia sp. TaxID=211434 RepID=UPI0035CAD9E7